MKRLLYPLLFISFIIITSGCNSYTRHTVFITSDELKTIEFGDSYENIYFKLGHPLYNLTPSNNLKILEYHFRHKNKMITHLPKLFSLGEHNFTEEGGGSHSGIFSGGTDYVIILKLKNDKLIEINIGGNVYKEKE